MNTLTAPIRTSLDHLLRADLVLTMDGDAEFAGTVAADDFTGSNIVITGGKVTIRLDDTIDEQMVLDQTELQLEDNALNNLLLQLGWLASQSEVYLSSFDDLNLVGGPNSRVFRAQKDTSEIGESTTITRPSSGQLENVVHHGTGTASSVGVEGTLHTEDV